MTYLIDTNSFSYEYETVLDVEYLVAILHREGKKIALTTKARTGNDYKDKLEVQQVLIGAGNINKLPVITYE
jgi:predicted nucleotidyltransferase